ncbi:MAG: protein-disulfide reductase DsbD domain-containing protein [Bacteroidota bacterium]
MKRFRIAMIRYLFLLFFSMFFDGLSIAQEHITWDFTYNSSTSEIEMKASLDNGWHIYSQHLAENAGPVPTRFIFQKDKAFKLSTKVMEPTPIEEFDKNFESNVKYFDKEVVFTNKVKVKKQGAVRGTVTYMICNEVMCMPPVDQQFEIKIPKE